MAPPDFLALALRALSFISALQAAGFALFLCIFGHHLQVSAGVMRRLGRATAGAALLVTLAHHLVEPARMTGTFSGILDASLQAFMLASEAGTAASIRILGLAMILVALLKLGRPAQATALVGATLVAVSFAFMGHTATHDLRWLLAMSLIVHLLVVAFWLGALAPLYLTSRRESSSTNGSIIKHFSSIAVWLVPLIFVAGLVMSIALVQSFANLLTPYGLVIVGKVTAFAILMGLAALNKWRLGPMIGGGQAAALNTFRRSVLAEWGLIAAVIAATAVMTALFSPNG